MLDRLSSIQQILSRITAAISASACAGFADTARSDSALAPVWAAWERADFPGAAALGTQLLTHPDTVDAGHHLLALVAHVSGEYASALEHYEHVGAEYRWLPQLDEPILWSYVHLHDWDGAVTFAEKRPIGRKGATRKRLELAASRPLTTEIEGIVEISFTDDALTPYMPGFPVRLNGRPTVARLDTGGSFVHLSSEQAAAHGIETVACEKVFAALTWGNVCYGVSDLDIGPIRLVNVPVAVHESVLPVDQLTSAFGVEFGPIVGTNVLQQFLSTVDGPNHRFVFSPRRDSARRTDHLAQVRGDAVEVPFAMWSDHYMIVQGRLGSRTGINLFVDTGLVAVNPEQGQAGLLASRKTLESWGVLPPRAGRFADLPGALAIGSASRDKMSAFSVRDRKWRDFGDWGGIRIDALISWGFLNNFTWTIDFDRRLYLLS